MKCRCPKCGHTFFKKVSTKKRRRKNKPLLELSYEFPDPVTNFEEAKLFSNPIRSLIMGILINKDKPKVKISELHKSICKFQNHEYDYKTIYKQVIILKNKGYVKLKKEQEEQGRPVYVELLTKRNRSNAK